MPFQRMTSSILFAVLATASASTLAAPLAGADLRAAFELDRAGAIASIALPAAGTFLLAPDATADAETASADTAPAPTSRLRKVLADFSMSLRNIRYRRGGHDPSTGFDCSGFVRYVYQHTLGAVLPRSSAAQFHDGVNVARSDMKAGDLVFFRIHGKRVSHVGIYLGGNQFIHSPSTGKRVSVSSLDDAYWARRFVGAKRPDVLG